LIKALFNSVLYDRFFFLTSDLIFFDSQ